MEKEKNTKPGAEANGKTAIKKQTEKVKTLKDGLTPENTGPGDPKTAQKGLI